MAELIPISTYKIVHTMGKRIDGGDRGGVVRVLYISILFLVRNAESRPMAMGIIMAIK